METEKIKISLTPKKIAYLVLIVLAFLVFAWLVTKNKNSRNMEKKQQEIVLPMDFGVSDPGFEGKITSFTTLNAKASVDKRDKIDDVSSLKIAFSNQPIASVKVPSYFNSINEGDYYRIGFWAKSDSDSNKKVVLHIALKEKIQDLGEFSLNKNEDTKYFEFNFLAENVSEDLLFTSSDSLTSNVWIDDVAVEKIDIGGKEELKDLMPTIFGSTTWKNVDQSQVNEGGDTGDFLSRSNRKIGQIFHPTREMLSGVAIKMFRHGTGGAGTFQLQIREFDEKLGVISDDVLATGNINHLPNPEALEEMKKREQQIREEFARNEQNIKNGKTPNDETTDRYPDTFTEDQIDAAKIVKRTSKLEVSILDMKESFNTVSELNIPFTTKLDTNKKYWIGIDNSKATVTQNDYISVVTVPVIANISGINNGWSRFNNNIVKQNATDGFMSELPGIWTNSSTFWFKTFYPEHSKFDGSEILSGATISDLGKGKLVYRYHFTPNDYSSLSGFSGRKVYDMLEGSYQDIDYAGNYELSYDDFVTYKLSTIYKANKIIVRDATFDQSLALEISTDGENWEEIYSDNPAEDKQTIDPIVYSPKEKSSKFYLRIKPGGDTCLLSALSIEADLEK